MRVIVGLVTACVLLPGTPAWAKVCKPGNVTVESQPHTSRTFQAIPGSFIAWRRAVTEQFGSDWSRWLRAEDQAVFCDTLKDGENAGKWVCARTARPCSGPLGKEELPLCQAPMIVVGPLNRQRDTAAEGAREKWRQTALEQFGAQYAVWDRSYDRKVRCDFATGTYRCEAGATPCRAPTDAEAQKNTERLGDG
ncbi:MAG: hypothetical protein AAGF32_03935 [Pseudomonadota bacterium]